MQPEVLSIRHLGLMLDVWRARIHADRGLERGHKSALAQLQRQRSPLRRRLWLLHLCRRNDGLQWLDHRSGN